ncbi:MAG: FHA domain-containing protein [Candidatus Cloacimonetes bacterium]|nr:FHA domain-containing protein [Candidatus Cloacimonadota bacterium]
MEPIVLRIHEYGHSRCQIQKFASPSVIVGRGLDADCLLDDQYISPAHCRITMEDDTLWIEDLHSTNGTFVRKTAIKTKQPIDSGTTVRLGRTRITIFRASHRVPPADVLETGFFRFGPGRIVLAWFMMALFPVLSTIIKVNQGNYYSGFWNLFLGSGITDFLSLTLLVVIWSLISKIFTHRPHFHSLLLNVALFALFITLLSDVVGIWMYGNIYSERVVYYFIQLITAGAIVILLQNSLKVSTSLSLSSIRLVGLAVAIVFCGVSMHTDISTYRESKYKPLANSTILPPALRLTPAQDAQEFFRHGWDDVFAQSEALAQKNREEKQKKRDEAHASNRKKEIDAQ